MRVRVKKKSGCLFRLFLVLVLAAALFYGVRSCRDRDSAAVFNTFIARHQLSENEYPRELIELYDRNPEAREFVLNYPLLKDETFDIDLSEYQDANAVPLFLQWDERWGYKTYGSQVMGLTGCGPTSLSMVAVYLLNDTGKSPAWMADYSVENGYCVPGNGTAWELMSTGARRLGLTVTELPLVEQTVADNLNAGNPIIAIMGPGDFTDTGHFIVLTGYEDGKLVVNDPNSPKNSKQLWSFDQIQDQIQNLWAYRV